MIKQYILYAFLLFTFCSSAQTPTGNSQEVGLTEGELSVSLSGSAVYNIPIAAPPGINAVEPTIQLSYNSNSGSGQAGFGWNINGISRIVRVPSTRYHDNIKDPVDFDSSDRFALDGERLMLKTGTYGGDGTEYQTENYTNTKITSYGTSTFGSGPAYFLVQYPDGSKAYYGNVNGALNSTINEWAINYWENPQGVRISYTYYTYSNILYINTISYGSLGATTPVNSIQFIYKTKVRPEQMYIGNTEFIQDRLLSEIKVLSNGVGFRNYVLAHTVTSLNHERLISVTEKSGDNTKSYNPTIFTYDTTTESISYSSNVSNISSVSNITMLNSAVVSGNYDDDERMDFIMYPSIGTSAKTKFIIFRSDGWPDYEIPVTFEEICAVNFLKGDQASGYQLMSKQGFAIVQQETSQVHITVYALAPSGGIIAQYERFIPNSSLGGDVERKYYAGDFNGDGLTDIMAVVKSTGNCYFINLDKRITTGFYSTAGGVLAVADTDQIQVADFNGDGRSDLYHFENANLRVIGLGEGNIYVSLLNWFNDSDIKTDRPILMGDYNGDGKADFIIPKSNNLYAKYLSKGTSMIKSSETFDVTYSTTSATNRLIASDMNGDGKTDLIKVENPDNNITVSIYKNMASNFILSAVSNTGNISAINTYAIPIFLNSETPNKNYELAFITNNSVYRFQSNKDFSKEKLLRTIRTAYGVTNTITYSSLAPCNNPGCISIYLQDGTTATQEFFPNFDVNEAVTFKVVSKIEEQTINQYKQQDYRYLGGVINYEGRGFLGFKGILKTNWHVDNSDVISNISKYSIAKRGALTEDHSVVGWGLLSTSYSPTNFILKLIRNYEDQLYANKVYRIKNTSNIKYNGLEGTSKEFTNTFDTYNNIISSASTTKLSTTVQQTAVETFEYFDNPAGPTYYIGRLKTKTSSVTHNGSTMTAQSTYSYTNNLLVQKKYRGHDTPYITEDYEYDTFGNMTKKTKSATGINSRVEQFEYDTSGRFLTKSTDIDGLVTQNTYNYSKGWLTSITNPYGLTTQYTYDVWGKKIKETDYLGNVTNITYSVSLNPSAPSKSTIGADGSSKFSWYDDLGREMVTGSKDVDGTFSYVTTNYNINNQKKLVTKPYTNFLAPATQGTQYTYDLYGRLIQTTEFTGKVTTNTYSGVTTVTGDGFKTTTFSKNSLGYTVSVSDNSGTITYDYYPDGHLKKTDVNGIVTKTQQDGWGRKTKLGDPSAGIYEYTYNIFGELTSEITPKGTSTYVLDAAGKISEKTVIGENTNQKTTYTYDPTTKLLTFKLFEDFIEGFSSGYTYEYDSYQRLWRTSENTSNAFFQKATLYDSFGRPEKLYNSAVHTATSKSTSNWVKKTYKYGHEWQLLDDDTGDILWQVNSVNEYNRLTSADYGNGISIANSFDQYGLPLQSVHTNTVTSENVMTLSTTFEPQRANVLSRSNSMFNWNESFQYDNLDRLSQFTNAAGTQEQQSYDSEGRIASNSFGTYTYDTTKPYQNKQITLSERGKAHYYNREGLFISTMEDKQGWTATNPANMIYDTSKARTGQYSLRVYNPTSSLLQTYGQGQVLISNNTATQYTISGWVYNSTGQQSRLYLVMMSSGLTISSTYETSTTVGQWSYIEKTVNVASGVIALNVQVGTLGTGYTWFDDIHLRKTSDISAQRLLNISYDMLNNPIQIDETGVDKINFTYHDSGSRYSMFYGSTASDKLVRPLRKHYSSDGSMEIKYNTVTGIVEFITYLDGDPYTTPVVARSNGYETSYLYLHKDYQGSIMAISDQNGNVLEKRLYDAWGNIARIESFPINPLPMAMPLLDRGYTGHEHLLSVGLVNMNGRIYDAKIHRFLQPDNYVQDPYNTQSYNRFGYALNNPLKYVDINGEISFNTFLKWVVGAVAVVAIIFTVAGIGAAGAGAWALVTMLGDSAAVYIAATLITTATIVTLSVLAWIGYTYLNHVITGWINEHFPPENPGQLESSNLNGVTIYGINQKARPATGDVQEKANENAIQTLQIKFN